MNNFNVSKNFKLREFECKDGSKLVKLDARLLEKVQILRDKLNVPLSINSGFRTESHNKKVGGVPNSLHLQGKAVDISTRNISMTDEKLIQICEQIGFDGIGIYNTFIHLDVRGYKHRFDYRTKGKQNG